MWSVCSCTGYSVWDDAVAKEMQSTKWLLFPSGAAVKEMVLRLWVLTKIEIHKRLNSTFVSIVVDLGTVCGHHCVNIIALSKGHAVHCPM